MKKRSLALLVLLVAGALGASAAPAHPPHIVLVMADDMGWGETGYNGHPRLKTPNLDAMAAAGLRFDRFYAGAPNCSPTRATVLTGRTNDRTGTHNHGFALRLQEKTLAQALKAAGYVTAHFGKWHLSGYRGPGAPLLPGDRYSPSAFGFDEWLSVTNFFDRDPLLSRQGAIEEFSGDSSEIIVAEALRFLERTRRDGRPTFTMIWYGTPHSPFIASDEDKTAFADLDEASRNHYGELVALDRSIGTLRDGLRRLGMQENTLVWFCSDNGGLPGITPRTTGPLRDFKNSVYEGGLRVPAMIEWPAGIPSPRVTAYPAGTVDIFPTLAAIVGLPESALLRPIDGESLAPLFAADQARRGQPLGFRHTNRAAWIDNHLKLVVRDLRREPVELYDLAADPGEQHNLAATRPDLAAPLVAAFRRWNASVEASLAGRDYPEGRVTESGPAQRDWRQAAEYEPFFPEWRRRPEYHSLNPSPAAQGDGSTPAAQIRDTLQAGLRELPGATVEIYKQVGDAQLRINIVHPKDYVAGRTYPAIVYFYGGGWRNGTVRQFEKHCRHFAERGMMAFAVDYRVTERHGTGPVEAVQDARSAMRWIRKNAARLGVDPHRIVAAGGSAGGHLALTLATIDGVDEPGEDTTISTHPDALVLYNPVVKTSEGGNSYEVLGERGVTISPIDHVRAGLPPMLLFHGEADEIVPFRQVEEFCRRMQAAGNRCELKSYRDKKHGFFNREEVQGEIIGLTDEFLAGLGVLKPAGLTRSREGAKKP